MLDEAEELRRRTSGGDRGNPRRSLDLPVPTGAAAARCGRLPGRRRDPRGGQLDLSAAPGDHDRARSDLRAGGPARPRAHLPQASRLADRRAPPPQVDSSLAADWRAAQADLPVQIAEAYIGASATMRPPPSCARWSRRIRTTSCTRATWHRSTSGRTNPIWPPGSTRICCGGPTSRREISTTSAGATTTCSANPEAADVFERAATASRRDRDAFEMWTRSLQLQHGRDSASATPASLQELIGAAGRWVELDPNTPHRLRDPDPGGQQDRGRGPHGGAPRSDQRFHRGRDRPPAPAQPERRRHRDRRRREPDRARGDAREPGVHLLRQTGQRDRDAGHAGHPRRAGTGRQSARPPAPRSGWPSPRISRWTATATSFSSNRSLRKSPGGRGGIG